MIELVNLSKKFGSFTAVNEVNLTIEPGTIFAFLGTNGAGKTTTIRMLTGVLQPTSGTAKVDGFDIQKDPIKAKSLMGVIPDRPYIYTKLTGKEFLHFVASLYKVKHSIAVKRVGELLEVYGLFDWQDDLIESYSHGMRQRLLMCSAQIHNPKILVIDEPMVGLDPQGAKLLKDSLRAHAEAGMTIFMSTHSLSVAQEIADKMAIIRKGTILAHGTLDEIYSKSTSVPSDLENAFLQIINENEM